MPILFHLKKPPVSLAVKGKIDEKFVKDFSKQVPCIKLTAVDDMTIVIPTAEDTNVAYIKEISQETFKEMQDKKKEESEGSRVVRPSFQIPGGKRRPS